MDVAEIARKHSVSVELTEVLMDGLKRTGGRQVQFNVVELGGMGQWMPGMTMIGKMGDSALKAKVDSLCRELAELVTHPQPASRTQSQPNADSIIRAATAAGSQNGIRYAYYADQNTLVLTDASGVEQTYDVTGYRITGVAQQQSSGTPNSVRFTTDTGQLIDIGQLRKIS